MDHAEEFVLFDCLFGDGLFEDRDGGRRLGLEHSLIVLNVDLKVCVSGSGLEEELNSVIALDCGDIWKDLVEPVVDLRRRESAGDG